MRLLVGGLPLEPVVHLTLYFNLTIVKILLAFDSRLVLLLFDHVLKLVSLLDFGVFLAQPGLFSGIFVHFGFVRNLFCRVLRHLFVHLHALVDIVLDHQVLAGAFLLLLKLLLLAFQLLVGHVHVAPTLSHNVVSSLSCFINLLDRLQRNKFQMIVLLYSLLILEDRFCYIGVSDLLLLAYVPS